MYIGRWCSLFSVSSYIRIKLPLSLERQHIREYIAERCLSLYHLYYASTSCRASSFSIVYQVFHMTTKNSFLNSAKARSSWCHTLPYMRHSRVLSMLFPTQSLQCSRTQVSHIAN